MQSIFIKKYFLFTLESVWRVKRFTTWQTYCWWRRGWNAGAEVAETTDKRLLRCGFRRSGKAMGQAYERWLRICREMNVFFQVLIKHVYPFVTCLVTLPHMKLYVPSEDMCISGSEPTRYGENLAFLHTEYFCPDYENICSFPANDSLKICWKRLTHYTNYYNSPRHCSFSLSSRLVSVKFLKLCHDHFLAQHFQFIHPLPHTSSWHSA
jgi:hypothetical protein